MNTSANLKVCPKCQAPIPAEAPQGLCPKCVLAGAALATEAGVPATATSEIPSIERIAAAFPQLEILELIGRGGMGFVFKARQPHLDRCVALKLLPDKLAKDAHFAERFNREGRVLARLNHPNIVSVFDFGQSGGFYFLLMEYVDGVNLRQAMQAGRFSPSEALAIVPKICEALQYAHEQGVLHRDIKPENILLDAKGRVKIADFGIAKLVGEGAPPFALTGTGATLGTPHYMAPEQLEQPAQVDHRADIYSLGVVFYEMLTGELPIGRFAPPSAKTPVTPTLDEVVFRTLEKDREKRYQSAGEVKTQVESVASEAQAAAQAASIAPAADFVLCNPRLPRMAQAITAYALVGAPLFWLLGVLTHDSTPPANAYAAFVFHVSELLTWWAELLTAVLLFVGGLKLRRLRPAGPRFIRGAVWLRIVNLSLIMGAIAWMDALSPKAEISVLPASEALVALATIAALGFEITALVWLRRHRDQLDQVCRPVPGAGQRGTVVVGRPAGEARFSRKAIWGAALVAFSLPLPVFVLGVVLTKAGGIGWGEIALTFGASVVPAIAGTILGWIALSDIRAQAGRLRGVPLAVFAALTWPLLVLVAVTLGVPSMMLIPADASGAWVTIGRGLALLLPAGVLTFALWAVYASARWASGQPATQRRGVLKWVFFGLLACGVGFVLVMGSGGSRSRMERPTPVERQGAASSAAPLPAGTVELIALSRHPSDNVWWRPDGKPAGKPPFKNSGKLSEPRPGERAVEMVFRTRGLPDDATPSFVLEGSSGWTLGGPPLVGGRPFPNSFLLTASYPRSLRKTTIKASIASGPWETVARDAATAGASVSLVRDGKPWKVAFLGAVEDKKGDTVLTLTHNIQNQDLRAVAVDADGEEHPSLLTSSTRESLRATFVQLPLGRIREFQLQGRAYRRVEFKDVVLEPSAEALLAGAEPILLNFRVAKGQVATFEVCRRDTDPPTPVPFFSAFFAGPDDERARGVFALVPTKASPSMTNAPAWSMRIAAEHGRPETSGGIADFGELLSSIQPAPNNFFEVGPERSFEIMLTHPHMPGADTNQVAPRAALSLIVASTAYSNHVTQPREGITVSIGSTNWMKALKDLRPAAKKAADPPAWIRFTFTAVELRPDAAGRWLAIDYVDDIHGNCQPAFRWEVNVPGFTGKTRKTSFVTDPKGGSPAVRHQRVEFLMPEFAGENDLRQFRDDLAKGMVGQSVVARVGAEEPVFKFPLKDRGTLGAFVGAAPGGSGEADAEPAPGDAEPKQVLEADKSQRQ